VTLAEGGAGMKQFWCGAVIPECDAKFLGKSDEEVLAQVAEHARRDHDIAELPNDVRQRVRGLIREAP
jgi:predicted small metal-binding protein